MWGILCAASVGDALHIAEAKEPLIIKHVVAGTFEGSELGMFQSGTAFDELTHGHVWRKGAPSHTDLKVLNLSHNQYILTSFDV